MSGPDATRLMTMSCTIFHTEQNGPEDDFGTPTFVTTESISRCFAEQRYRADTTAEGEDIATTEWWLFLPPLTPIDEGDHVEVAGIRYEVDGPAWNAWNPIHQRYSHIELTLRRVA